MFKNKKGEKMKTITITLTEEQEKLFLSRLSKGTWRLSEKEITFLQRDKKGYKNPSEWTKERVEDAKKSRAKMEKEWKLADGFLKQIKEQLEKENQ